MSISAVRWAMLALAIFLTGWFWIVSQMQQSSRATRLSAEHPAAVKSAEDLAREAAAERAVMAAQVEAVRAIAKELAYNEYMQPPYVGEFAQAGLAREAAILIVSGRCTRADFEEWGWAKASLPGHAGEYFTYCDSGGQPQIIYVTPF